MKHRNGQATLNSIVMYAQFGVALVIDFLAHVSSSMKTWYKLLCITVLTFLFLLYSPTLLDFKPTKSSIPFPALTGPLAVNDKLSATEHLFGGILSGPESMVFHKGYMYTGLKDGRIVKVKGDKVITVAQTGRDCRMPYEEQLCGRPLGLRIGNDGLLYITDAFYGILNMNFTTGSLTRVLPSSVLIEGQKLSFPDDLDIDNEGNIYFTDASSKWDLSTIYYMITENENSGRVIKYNIYTGASEVLLRNLYFPNGIQLSHDGNSLLICEIMKRRILRYYIKGAKKGQVDIFTDVLPGEPDNIRKSSRGGYWVALTSARSSSNPLWLDRLNEYPLIKFLWARAHHGLGTVLMGLAEITSSPILKEYAYLFRRGDIVLTILPRHGIIIEFDADGNILRTLQAPDGKTSDLSQATEHEGYLYLGSFVNEYLGRLKL